MHPLMIKAKDQRKEQLKDIRDAKKLFIWGNGSYSHTIKAYLESEIGYTGEILTLLDDEYCRPDDSEVVPLSQILDSGGIEAPVVFGFYNYIEVQRKKEKFAHAFPNMIDIHFTVVNGKRLEWDPTSAKARIIEYQFTYDLLMDEQSRQVMQLYLNAATAGEFHELFTHSYEAPAFFNRITEGLQVDTLIDCGAYDGDSIHDFVMSHPEYSHIIAVEPDSLNVEKLHCRETRERFHNLSIVSKGLGSEIGEYRFRLSGASNSCFDADGESVVPITTLDAITETLFTQKIPGRLFVKMDIEGSELDALKGARQLIRSYTPILAVCVYHREEDLIEIPKLIDETAGKNSYDYHLGFHGLDLAELVFYAIPRAVRQK